MGQQCSTYCATNAADSLSSYNRASQKDIESSKTSARRAEFQKYEQPVTRPKITGDQPIGLTFDEQDFEKLELELPKEPEKKLVRAPKSFHQMVREQQTQLYISSYDFSQRSSLIIQLNQQMQALPRKLIPSERNERQNRYARDRKKHYSYAPRNLSENQLEQGRLQQKLTTFIIVNNDQQEDTYYEQQPNYVLMSSPGKKKPLPQRMVQFAESVDSSKRRSGHKQKKYSMDHDLEIQSARSRATNRQYTSILKKKKTLLNQKQDSFGSGGIRIEKRVRFTIVPKSQTYAHE